MEDQNKYLDKFIQKYIKYLAILITKLFKYLVYLSQKYLINFAILFLKVYIYRNEFSKNNINDCDYFINSYISNNWNMHYLKHQC